MPSYALLYQGLRGFYPICTTRILLLKITTFCPNMTKITAADHQVGGWFYRLRVLFGIKKYATNLGNLLVIGGIVFRFG